MPESLCMGVGPAKPMQLIFLTSESVEEYESRQSQLRIAAPKVCPNCGAEEALEPLGYYHRYVRRTDDMTPRIPVRRFRCVRCRRTTSLLPGFAQPYKLVANATIEAFARGELERADVHRWHDRLLHYWKGFLVWAPRLRLRIGKRIPMPKHFSPVRLWKAVLDWAGDLAEATIRLTRSLSVTLFGEYKCHRPNPP